MKRQFFVITFICLAQLMAAQTQYNNSGIAPSIAFIDKHHYISAAMQFNDYLPLIEGKRVGVVGNQTALSVTRIWWTHCFLWVLTFEKYILRNTVFEALPMQAPR